MEIRYCCQAKLEKLTPRRNLVRVGKSAITDNARLGLRQKSHTGDNGCANCTAGEDCSQFARVPRRSVHVNIILRTASYCKCHYLPSGARHRRVISREGTNPPLIGRADDRF